MSACEGGRRGYVVGVTLIVTATLLSLTGTLTPGWLTFRSPSSNNVTSEGLFLRCRGSRSGCAAVDLLEIECETRFLLHAH